MKKLLLFFAFTNSYWAFGQLTYTFDVEYYSCGNHYSQYCQPNATISSTGYSEPFNVFYWSFGYGNEDYHRGSRSLPKKDTYTIGIDDEFVLSTGYDYDNSFYTLDAKPPGRTVYEPSCGYCDYKHYYSPYDFGNPGGARYYGESRGRIFYQGRYVDWRYEAYREPQNTTGTADTQDLLSVKVPMTRMAGSNCYDRQSNQNYIANDPNDRDYCVECSIVTGGIAYDSADDVPDGQIILSNFRPNGLEIYKVNSPTLTDFIAGEKIEFLAWTPSVTSGQVFPNFVYNWQFSTDGGTTWQNVPDLGIDGQQTNKKPNPSFSMQQILGDSHVDYFGPIDFRLGYGSGNRAFSNTLHLNYAPGAPIIKKIKYDPPVCNGYEIPNITVTFDRNLLPQEELRYFQLIAVDPSSNIPDGTPSVYYPFIGANNPSNGLVTKFDENSPGVYTYSLSNFNGLNPNSTYQIQYQAFVNNTNKGPSISPKGENFKHVEPAPVSFKIIKSDNPLCNNGKVEIVIQASGGTGNYLFYLDNNLIETPTKNANDGLYYIQNLEPKNYTIKVTDDNKCIDKHFSL